MFAVHSRLGDSCVQLVSAGLMAGLETKFTLGRNTAVSATIFDDNAQEWISFMTEPISKQISCKVDHARPYFKESQLSFLLLVQAFTPGRVKSIKQTLLKELRGSAGLNGLPVETSFEAWIK